MILQLLRARRRGPEERPPALHQVGPAQPQRLVHEEILLLRAERDGGVAVGLAETGHQPTRRAVERLHRTQQRRLLVQHLAGVRAEDRRDAKRGAVAVALDEDRARDVPGRVAARLEGPPQAAAGEARGVRLAHDQVLARETRQGLGHARRLEEGVVLLRRAARERLEPVREMRRPPIHPPLLQGVRHLVGDRGIQRRVVAHRVQQRLRRVLRQILPHRLLVEDVRAIRDFLRRVHPRSFQ